MARRLKLLKKIRVHGTSPINLPTSEKWQPWRTSTVEQIRISQVLRKVHIYFSPWPPSSFPSRPPITIKAGEWGGERPNQLLLTQLPPAISAKKGGEEKKTFLFLSFPVFLSRLQTADKEHLFFSSGSSWRRGQGMKPSFLCSYSWYYSSFFTLWIAVVFAIFDASKKFAQSWRDFPFQIGVFPKKGRNLLPEAKKADDDVQK